MKCVLAIITKEGCIGCENFTKNEYPALVRRLKDVVRIVSFHISNDGKKIPFCIAEYAFLSPSFILLNPRSYSRYYNEDGTVKSNAPDNYVIKGFLYSSVRLDEEEELETGNKYGHFFSPMSAESISAWVNWNIKNVMDLE